VVDRAAVARFLLAEELLAAFDEEVGDVEDTDLQLLDEEGDEAGAVQRIRGMGALELGSEKLHEPHLRREKARRRKLRDDPVPRMRAQEAVGLDIGRIGDVPGPAGASGLLVGHDARPLGLGKRQRGTDVADPPGQEPWGPRQHEVRQLAPYGPLLGCHLL
jgi:hypothetical protein